MNEVVERHCLEILNFVPFFSFLNILIFDLSFSLTETFTTVYKRFRIVAAGLQGESNFQHKIFKNF